MATKKKTTKTTSSRSTSSPSRPAAPPEPTSPARTTALPAVPPEPTIQVKPYKHVGDQLVSDFLKKHSDGVYFQLDAVSKKENESAIKSLPPKTPVFVVGRSFSAGELIAMGFEVFQNGPGGKLVGIRK